MKQASWKAVDKSKTCILFKLLYFFGKSCSLEDIQILRQNRAAKEIATHPNIIRNHAGPIFGEELQQKYKDTKRSAVRRGKTQIYTKNNLQLFLLSVYTFCTYRVCLCVKVGKTYGDVCVNRLWMSSSITAFQKQFIRLRTDSKATFRILKLFTHSLSYWSEEKYSTNINIKIFNHY